MKWSVTNLESLSVFGPQYGANARAVAASGKRPRYVRITDIDSNGRLIPGSKVEADIEDESEFLLQEGDLLFARSGNTVGKSYRYSSKDGPCIFAGYLIRFRSNSRLADSQFVFYFTQSHIYQSWVMSKRRVAGQPNINGKEYSGLRLPLPPISEQRRIVEILDRADALRKKRDEVDMKAARILPALFYEMFGDPATNPRKWPTETLGNLFDVVGGGTPSKSVSEFWAGDIPWVSPKDMKSPVIEDTEDHITREAISSSATRLIKQGSVLVVYRSGILVHSFPVAIAGRELTINQDLKALSSKGELLNEYLYGLFSAAPSIGLACVKKGATVHNVDGVRFFGLKIPKPAKNLQVSFAIQLETLLKHQTKRQTVGVQIEKLFDVLLHLAFTGDLTSKWREAHIKKLLGEMEAQARALGLPVSEIIAPEVPGKRLAGPGRGA